MTGNSHTGMEITLKIKLDQALAPAEISALARMAERAGRSVEEEVAAAIRCLLAKHGKEKGGRKP